MKKSILKEILAVFMVMVMIMGYCIVIYARANKSSTSTNIYLEDGVWAYAQLIAGEGVVSAYAELDSYGDFAIAGECGWKIYGDGEIEYSYFSNSEDEVYSCEAGLYDSNKVYINANAKYTIYSYESGVDRSTKLYVEYNE